MMMGKVLIFLLTMYFFFLIELSDKFVTIKFDENVSKNSKKKYSIAK